ncbi:pilus assembly protein [Peteryoungia desertarenae]|uniref:Pilus assembly protein n=1 Tax=Peteryoungia desertarenae TaxID=1813451 RepID=A0ABX6QPK5_9HYPH|nr:TadE/TadG family type IV pilus assembly protein [Peteryoungia desertarenae]QLF70534.1 pilus assembly protein [Peteryoungia desertarenae]
MKRKGLALGISRDVSGATAIEFAILAPIFLSLVFGIFCQTLVTLQLSHLDYATYEAATELRLRSVSARNIEDFKTTVVCPAASPLLRCEDISVGVDSNPQVAQLSHWQGKEFIGKFCTGTAGSIVAVSVHYTVRGMFSTLYFGASTKENDVVTLRSRYFVVREPTVSGEGIIC